MAVRIYGISGGGVKGKGYPTADVSGIIGKSAGGLTNILKWTDPEDTILDNSILASWKSTLLIRKVDSIPENHNDGDLILENTERNKYKDEWFSDSNNLEEGKTYYYRFFTKSTKGVIGDGSPSIKITAYSINPILSENTWEQIAEVSESGAASVTWNIGDEIEIGFSNPNFPTATFQIADFEHYDKSDGTGKVGIVFVSKDVLYLGHSSYEDVGVCFNDSGSSKGYLVSDVKNVTEQIFNSMDSTVRQYVKTIVLPCDNGGDYPSKENGNVQAFIPSAKEVGTSVGIDDSTAFPIFTDSPSRKKIAKTTSGYAKWWTRTGVRARNGGKYVVNEGGGVSDQGESWYSFICLCFCV